MNALFPYEKQVAGKLEKYPLPDMQDAIWARIDTMLDASPGIDEPDTVEAIVEPANKIAWQLKVASIVIIIAVIVALSISKRKKRNVQKDVPAITVPAKPNSNKEADTDTKGIALPPADAKPSGIKPGDDNTVKTINDSLAVKPPLQNNEPLLKKPDSALTIKSISPDIRKKDTVVKKPKGIPGISDSDYRFVTPKKDSIKN